MSAHTPGPWVVYLKKSTRPRRWAVVTAGAQYVIASDIYSGGRDLPIEETTEANAHLIAAAPDLLAALRECQSLIGSWAAPASKELVRAAIAKAEGKS